MMKKMKYLGLLLLLVTFVVGCSGNTEEVSKKSRKINDTEAETENNNKEDVEKDEDTNNSEENESKIDGNDLDEEDMANEDKDHVAMEESETDFDKAQNQKATPDEDLKLKDILGTADAKKNELVYKEDKKYHILELTAGLSNYNSQIIKNKWVAFAIPKGVSVPDVEEVPSGMVVVSLPDGHTGIAVKIPNLDGISDEKVKLEIPLIGEPDDNDPNKNLYLFNVKDGEKKKAELVGEISSKREIDFSVMKEK